MHSPGSERLAEGHTAVALAPPAPSLHHLTRLEVRSPTWPRCAEATAPARPASSGGSRRNEPASRPAQLLEGCHTPRPVGPCHHGAALRPPLPPPHSLTRAPRLAPFPGTAVGPSEQSRTISPRQDPRPGHSCGVPSGALIQPSPRHGAWRTPAHGVRSLLRPWSVPRSSTRLDRC